MKKIVFFIAAFVSLTASAQTTKKKKDWSKVTERPGDHIMVQLANDRWAGTPDSISSHLKSFSRGANVAIMLDRPFKNNPRFSIAFGVGVGTANMYFSKMNVDLTAGSSKLPFTSLDSSNHFKKYKLSTTYLEVPLELRFMADPETPNKSWKGAIGVKVGTLVSAHTKGKTLEDKNGSGLNSYAQKITGKRHFNGTELAVTGRIGYGFISLFGSYQVNSLFKDGVGPDVKPFQIGLCFSGL